jgi:hyperosmotically inducible protein
MKHVIQLDPNNVWHDDREVMRTDGKEADRNRNSRMTRRRKMMKMVWSRLEFAVILAGVSLPVMAQANRQQKLSARDQQVQKLATAELRQKEKFSGISASVEDGIVTLAGTAELFIDKENAEKRVRKVKNLDGVRNHIQIAGKEVTESELQETLANKLRYDRAGYGIIFNNLMVGVENGAVTVGGKVRDYPDRSSAIAIVETTPGVKDVIDEIDVTPVSNFDDELRVRLARAIYGHSRLQKYALDPQAPIRVIVENGNVELAGVVLNEVDRQIACIQANSVPGAFSVKNKLMVASDVRD